MRRNATAVVELAPGLRLVKDLEARAPTPSAEVLLAEAQLALDALEPQVGVAAALTASIPLLLKLGKLALDQAAEGDGQALSLLARAREGLAARRERVQVRRAQRETDQVSGCRCYPQISGCRCQVQ